jgi:hypothetical protein
VGILFVPSTFWNLGYNLNSDIKDALFCSKELNWNELTNDLIPIKQEQDPPRRAPGLLW